MVKIHLIGGENFVVSVADTSSLAALLTDPNGVLEVDFDGRPLLVPVRGVAGVVLMQG